MPWIYFPKSNISYYGYKADGFLTAIVFLIILIISVLNFKRPSLSGFSAFFTTIMGALMAFLSYYKLVEFEKSALNFNFENPMVGAAFAGAQAGIGVYIFGIAGAGVFLTAMFMIYNNKTIATKENGQHAFEKNKTKFYLSTLILITIASLAFYFFRNNSIKPINAETLQPVLSAEIENMGKALFEANYSEFVDYNHLIMVQSLGGKDKMIEMVQSSMEGLKESGTILKDISLSDIYDIRKEGRNVQVVMTQVLLYENNGIENTEIQKMLAVSEDNMNSWKFINITGKTKAEMKVFFPSLNKDLQF
ncbi:MAG: hypothetical protein IPM42_19335 [Saprospiraceae bacterium]|nr:hypothetical protein [Saprospiraceae bacterium]